MGTITGNGSAISSTGKLRISGLTHVHTTFTHISSYGPEGRQLIMPPNERPAEPLFCLDLSRLWADVCINSYVDSMCFGIYRCVHHARVMFST
jgi:hypothetical protein